MDFLQTTIFDNTLREWLTAIAIAVGLASGLRILVGLISRRFRTLAARTTNKIDDVVADVVSDTKIWVLLVVGFLVGARSLLLPEPVLGGLRYLGVAVGFVQVGIWGNTAITQTIRHRIRSSLQEDPAEATTMVALGFLIKLALWSVVLLAALSNMGIEIGPVLAGLGVGGIAVALAVQNVLGDLFASLSIVLDKPFVMGDFIVIDDFAGSIEHVGLKTTRLRSVTGEQLVFSNSDLLRSRIRNYQRMNERRSLFTIGVVYQTPQDRLEKIPDLIRAAIEATGSTRFDRAHFKRFGPSSLDFEVVYWVLNPDYQAFMDIQQAINLEIVRRFEAEGIEFAYPTQTLFVEGVRQ